MEGIWGPQDRSEKFGRKSLFSVTGSSPRCRQTKSIPIKQLRLPERSKNSFLRGHGKVLVIDCIYFLIKPYISVK